MNCDYVIKTFEETESIVDQADNIQLIPQAELEHYQNNYLHIGLAQLAIKPVTRIGLNTSVLAYGSDKHHESFKDSLIGKVKASLHNGPTIFNCFPNFSAPLTDPRVHEIITLGLQTKGFDMKPQFENITIIYRVYHKVMTFIVPDIAYIQAMKGVTTLFLTNFNNKTVVPKPITWDQVYLDHKWKITDA